MMPQGAAASTPKSTLVCSIVPAVRAILEPHRLRAMRIGYITSKSNICPLDDVWSYGSGDESHVTSARQKQLPRPA
jgi:hypothetical protein